MIDLEGGVRGAILCRDRIGGKDKDPSFSAKPTRAKDSVFGPKSMSVRFWHTGFIKAAFASDGFPPIAEI
jgi:hypothetical protein